MKKLILTAAVALFAFTANAQEEATEATFGFGQGDIFVEGNLGFGSTNDKNTEIKTSGFDFNPKAGYFISEDLAVGVKLSLNTNTTTNGVADTENKATTFGAGAFARYYFLDLGKRFKTYGEFGVGFGSTKNELTTAGVSVDGKSTAVNAGLGLGMNYFVTENFAINFGLSDVLAYNTEKADADGAEAVSSFGANLNVFNNFFATAQFGLTYKF